MDKKIIVICSILIICALGAYYYVFKMGNTAEQPADSLNFDPSTLNWEQVLESAPWPERDSHATVVFKNKIWLMGGVDGTKRMVAPGNVDYGNSPHFSDVWASSDGVNWELVLGRAPWGDRRSMQVVSFNGKMWLMGGWGPELGCKNDIWSSEDGEKWELEEASAKWPAREGHQVLVFQNKLWLFGGVRYDRNKTFNDIWYSEDGANWKQASEAAGWSPRWDFSAAVFGNRLWVAGGMDLSQQMFNDIWYSDDGANWSLETANAPYEPRQGFITEYKGRFWVIGRLDDVTNGGVNDVWYLDAETGWQKTKNDPAWTGREDFGAVIFNDKIWIIGGMDKDWKWRNDVWQSAITKNAAI